MTATGVELTRHELLWVLEQCGGDAWPYPLRPVHWAAETVDETTLHRGRTEQGLRRRGLLDPAPAALLLTVGEVVRDALLAADLVHRSPSAPRAAVVVSDGARAALLVSTGHADDPVHVALPHVERMSEALLGVLPPAAPGRGRVVEVSAADLAVPVGTPDAAPATRRAVDARRAARTLLDTATGWGQVGVAVHADGPGRPPVRHGPLVTWLDGPHGRHRLAHGGDGAAGRTRFAPVNGAQLTADIRTVLTGAAGAVLPRPPGRSSA